MNIDYLSKMMDKKLTIRAFQPKDRQRLRQICCDVADKGEPIENFFGDRVFAADLLTRYYTDYEPENCLVAEINGQVVGYLTSSLDNRRYGLVMVFVLLPQLILLGFWRGVFFRQDFLMIARAMLKNWKRLFSWRKESFHSHQGHFHIGVDKNFRRHKVGEGLVKMFLEQAKRQGAGEISASVHDQNQGACRFFEKLGFKAVDRYAMIMAYGQTLKEYHSIFYVKNLD